MYNKIRRREDSKINYARDYLDRDSGIVTECESDADYHRPHYIFSDDDQDVHHALNQLGDIHHIPQQQQQQQQQQQPMDSVYSSPSYYTSLADQSVTLIRHYLKDSGWKKVLKHKSGTTVYMLQSAVEKTALFRGEAIIQGFTPQSIFYVIGMRKLWDEQFEEGKLIDNLNDTTSLTYESYKSTTTSKAYDLTLVEKIECSSDGEILFACTSIDTAKVPKTPGKNRNQVKLQGWILRQLNTSPVSTKVTYITQENIKGWIPGLTKKSLARKPLIIASIDNYLRQKSHRLRLQLPPASSTSTLQTTTPSRLSPQSILQHNNNSSSSNNISIITQTSPTLGPSSSVETVDKKYNTIILSNPPPRISSLATKNSGKTKHISFADEVQLHSPPSTSSSSSARSSLNDEDTLSTTSSPLPPPPPLPPMHQLSPIHEVSPNSLPFSSTTTTGKKEFSSAKAVAGSKLYPASRHRVERKQCMDQLKKYAHSDINDWKLIGERNERTKVYTQAVEGSKLPMMRSDTTFYGTWTPEQICSVVQCFGARKIWDDYFEDGHVVERFSQKEYLIYMEMKSLFPIQSRDFSILSCIESNVSSGTIYVASTSVVDELIPPVSHHMRGTFLTYGWALEPLRSIQHRLIGVKATFIAHLEMGGTTPLPSAISRLLTNELPVCTDRVQSYLRQHGCPPYIRRVAGKITLEAFDEKEKQYTIHFTAKHAPSARQYRSRNTSVLESMWCTDLRTHPSMYPFGYTVESQPETGVRVEMRSDAMGMRIYTEREELDGQTVTVCIRQNRECLPGGKPMFQWNGTVLLNDVEEEEVKTDVDVPTIQEDKPHDDRIEQPNNKDGRRNSHLVILSDDLTFTGHQFSFVILLMVICYYLGKFSCRCSI
ncbi:hypothetical protein INT47_008619 [Mucor saturninus]|uniref:START domain-containing protein n=1 Tax=Mucor saturninus TaxID=64648 RepID=A0A8H7UWQ1_9FUNG|nr:hypothetical protein INT47_008619 [Mucor saturninus]